jgi:hypothetical protein
MAKTEAHVYTNYYAGAYTDSYTGDGRALTHGRVGTNNCVDTGVSKALSNLIFIQHRLCNMCG